MDDTAPTEFRHRFTGVEGRLRAAGRIADPGCGPGVARPYAVQP